MSPVSSANTHHGITDLVNHGMVKNTKTWISPEQDITLLWNKKKLTCASDGTSLRSDCFGAEVTFQIKVYT